MLIGLAPVPFAAILALIDIADGRGRPTILGGVAGIPFTAILAFVVGRADDRRGAAVIG